VVDYVAATIARRRPFAVTLNEMCQNQYDRLRARLTGYRGRFDATARCHDGTPYGNAVFLRSTTVDRAGGWDLPNPAGDEGRRLMCLRTHEPSTGAPLVVCVTHVSNYAGNIGPQVDAVAGHLAGLDPGDALVLGGDLNADRGDARLDPLYRVVGGDLPNGETYPGHTYDHVLLSDGDWTSAAAEVSDAGAFSDHDALWVTATPV
jgi:hypothetical protein